MLFRSEYGVDGKSKNKKAALVASNSAEAENVKKEYADSGKAPKNQPDYYPYWIDKMGTTDKGKTIYKYSNALHHTITSNIPRCRTRMNMMTAPWYSSRVL